MPHGLEYIVRPFQSPGSLGNVVIPGTPDRTEEKAHIVWGGKGTMPAVKLVNPDTVVNVCHETSTEQNRDSDIQRIYGNDPENWVDVARTRNMRLNKTERNYNETNLAGQLTTSPKLDPSIATDPGFHATVDNPNPDKLCGQVWHFNV